MSAKCYEIRRVQRDGPWEDGQELWERVATVNGPADSWKDVALRLLKDGRLVACRTCGVVPGTTWIKGRATDNLKSVQDYVCAAHEDRVALELEKGGLTDE